MTSPNNEEEVARLLREAGPRPEVADERIAAAMAVARPAWQAKVAERNRGSHGHWRPLLLAAAMTGFALLAAWWSFPFLAPAPAVAWVELASAGSLADGRDLAAGAPLTKGTSLEVDGLLTLRLVTGGSLRLDAGTLARLTGPGELTLEAGAAYFDSGEPSETAPTSPALTVTTDWGVARDIGTQFEVRLMPEHLAVRVREGKVEVTRKGQRHLAGAGEELRLDSDGGVVREPLSPGDASFEWVLAAAPPFDFDSGDLAAFFRWAARETGKELTWQPAGLSEEIETITFHGSVEGLTPFEALEVVAAATGLEVEVLGRELEIQRAP